jgi:hypothetical protein
MALEDDLKESAARLRSAYFSAVVAFLFVRFNRGKDPTADSKALAVLAEAKIAIEDASAKIASAETELDVKAGLGEKILSFFTGS